uniref:ribosomal protein S3 n=1 Tax=Euplotes vannus TaxID=5939 RepID=UPI002E772922|nr:ribosomal protein S3 [Euplotes vannus]UPM52098.1 ribosomal protein S3 [Euplotes vannus]
MRNLRKQLSNSRSSFWTKVSHWTIKPLKFKYYQLSLVLNRSAWLPKSVNWVVTTSSPKYCRFTKYLWTYVPYIFSYQSTVCLLWSPQALYLFRPQTTTKPEILNAWLRNRAALLSKSKCRFTLSLFSETNNSSTNIHATQLAVLKLLDTVNLFRVTHYVLKNLVLSPLSITQRFKKQMRLRYLQFLRRGSYLRLSFLTATRNSHKRHNKYNKKKQPSDYNILKFFNRKGMYRLRPTYVLNLAYSNTVWWYRTITLGLRTPYRLGVHTNMIKYLYRTRPSATPIKVNPIFFLFFRSLPSRLRYQSTHRCTQLTLTLKLLIWQKKITTNSIKTIRCAGFEKTQTNLSVQPKYARLLIRTLSRGSLLPSPYIAHYKRNWFTLHDNFIKASRRLLRFCLPWRSGLSFLNQRRRWLWINHLRWRGRSLFTHYTTVRATNPPTIRKVRRRFFLRGGFISPNATYGRLSFSGLQQSDNLLTNLTLQTRNLNGAPTSLRDTTHNPIKLKTLNANLRLFYVTTIRTKPQTVINNFTTYPNNYASIKNLTLRYWRLLISGELTNDKPRRQFIPIRGTYVSTYFSAYINRFFEYFLGTRVGTIVNFEILARVSSLDFFLLESIKSRLHAMNSAFSTIFFINEFIDLLYMALKLRNFSHLISYINRLLKSLVIWDHKRFLVFFFSAFREQFLPFFPSLGITGLQIIIRGKVGVGGNSRKRSMALRLGVTSRTHTFINTHTLNTWLNTTTGALGLRIFLYGTNNV